jgi:Predicted membrane protein (DUF2306)
MSADIATSIPRAPSRRFALLRPRYILFVLIGLMYAYVLWNNESFLVNHADPEWTHIAPFKWLLLPHGLAAGCTLILGPLQFSERLRRRFAGTHRIVGRIYIAGTLIGGPLGVYVQYFEHKHLGTGLSIVYAAGAQAAVWMLVTLVALAFILKKNVQQHRQWMTRSFASAIIFLEVRVIMGIFNLDPVQYLDIVVWGCVAAAVPLADFAIYAQDLFRKRATPAKSVRPLPQQA